MPRPRTLAPPTALRSGEAAGQTRSSKRRVRAPSRLGAVSQPLPLPGRRLIDAWSDLPFFRACRPARRPPRAIVLTTFYSAPWLGSGATTSSKAMGRVGKVRRWSDDCRRRRYGRAEERQDSTRPSIRPAAREAGSRSTKPRARRSPNKGGACGLDDSAAAQAPRRTTGVGRAERTAAGGAMVLPENCGPVRGRGLLRER